MATRAPTSDPFLLDMQLFTWTGLLNGDDGTPVNFMAYGDRTVTVTGTFSTGGTVVFEGSNDKTNWFTLTDPGGAVISRTTAGMKAVIENPVWVRPRVTAGDGSTDITVQLAVRRGNGSV